jgi:hypothetical protein
VAQKVEVVLTCDLDTESTPAVETVVFGYGGQTYEFELCKAHLDEFHEVMHRFTEAARPAGGRRAAGMRPRTPRPSRSAAAAAELTALREWARANGFEVNDRGRIPAHVRQAYEAAQH